MVKFEKICRYCTVDHQDKIGLLSRKFLKYVFNIGQGEGEENEDGGMRIKKTKIMWFVAETQM